MAMSKEEQESIALRFLDAWEQSTRRDVSVEYLTHKQLFYFIPIKHTVFDQASNPVFIVYDKVKALKLAKGHYNMILGKDLTGVVKDGTH